MAIFDFSTIDLEQLYRCRKYMPARTFHLQDNPGNGCALDPPGYPTYFTRVVFNRYGNFANNHLIITGPDGNHYIVGTYGENSSEEKLRRFWKPVPMDSLRIRLWEQACYLHWYSCYESDVPDQYGSRIRSGRNFALLYEQIQGFGDDPDYQELFQQCAQQFYSHFAYNYIQRFYPEYKMNVEWATYQGNKFRGETQNLSDGFFYNGQWIAHEANNRWWERYADPSVRVDYTGMAQER